MIEMTEKYKILPSPSEVENIVFDLGNVLIDIDLDATKRAFDTIIHPQVHPNLIQALFLQYEIGAFDEPVFIKEIAAFCKKDINEDAIIDAWNKILIGTNSMRWEFINQLGKKYRLFVLSNTNSTHIDWVHNDMKNNHNIDNFEKYFEKVYYSHLMKKRKPNLDIYHYLIGEEKFDPKSTLFIDDNYDNVHHAHLTGLQVYHHKIGNEISDIMKDWV